MKYFIITVDTEGDNLWGFKPGNVIGTENAKYLQRFQTLCDEYGYKPVYLTNYEMAKSEIFLKEAKLWLELDNCEIGIHLHAWNNPPLVDEIPDTGCQYLIEYSEPIMRQKFEVLYNLIVDRFKYKPVSHRAGRWAMDLRYFHLLEEFGVYIDCSQTPGLNWSSHMGSLRGGANYINAPSGLSKVGGVIEVPPTIRKIKRINSGSFKHRIKNVFIPDTVWLRPAMCDLKSMCKLIDVVSKEDETDYLEFMIHSSELMPGGSPYFKSEQDINREYEIIRNVFEYAQKKGYCGITLRDYVAYKKIR